MNGNHLQLEHACMEGIRAYHEQNLDLAASIFRQVLELDPVYPRALNALAVISADRGEYEQSLSCLEKVLRLTPNYEKAYNTRATVLVKMGRVEEAERDLAKAIAINPSFIEARGNLAEVQLLRRQWDSAIDLFDHIIKTVPSAFQAWYGKSKALLGKGLVPDAVASLQKAIDIKPDYARALAHLGFVKLMQHRIAEALPIVKSALQLDPDCPVANDCAGSVYLLKGDVDEAIDCFRKVLAKSPDDPVTHSKLVFSMHYSDQYSAEDILKEAVSWDKLHALEPFCGNTGNCPHPEIRIGFVSADFREHVILYFFEHLLQSLDRTKFRVYCYANVAAPDSTTERLKGTADEWADIAGMSDTMAAERIRSDGIDILVDLTGHTANNRLQLFSMKPAPVQASWLGYPGTTGVRAIDFRITDSIADPEGMTDSHHIEKLVRLADCFLCYRPEPRSPAIQPLPVKRHGGITFGSFNFIGKIRPKILAAWGRILYNTPGSRLILKSRWFSESESREKILSIIREEGVDPERVTLLTFLENGWDHLDCYNGIDIALDTFPYHGTTTTFESLWMGVPVVTLAGTSHVSRVSASILTNLNLDELVTHSIDEYIATAINLAQDFDRLELLRNTLRGRLSESALCDAAGFARKMENAFILMLGERTS